MDIAISIYKQDGTRQCEPDIKPRPLDVDAKVITSIGIHIIGNGKRERLPIFVPALCGSPTAWANVFAITVAGLTREKLFELSLLGFKLWEFSAAAYKALAGGEDPFPLSFPVAANLLPSDHPDLIKDLVGYTVRVYKTGDVLTDDYIASRFNIETDPQTHRIVRTWFG